MVKEKIKLEKIVDEETGQELDNPVAFKIPVYTTDDFGNEVVNFKKEVITREQLLEKIDSLNASSQAYQEAINSNQIEIDEINEKLNLI